MPSRFEDSPDQRPETLPWEPEPLELPLELPRVPDRRDDRPAEVESRLIVIDLV